MIVLYYNIKLLPYNYSVYIYTFAIKCIKYKNVLEKSKIRFPFFFFFKIVFVSYLISTVESSNFE